MSQSDYDKVLVEYYGEAAQVSPYRDNQQILDDGTASYGDFDKPRSTPKVIDDTWYLIPGILSGSDYNGSIVEKSNHREFLDKFAPMRGVVDLSGGYGSFGVAINLAVISPAEDAIWETLLSLKDYPILDDDRMSEMETEAQNEAWENWARSDFIRAIAKSFELSEEDEELLDYLKNNDPHQLVFNLFRELEDRSNTYWVNEQGDTMHIDIDRITDAMTDVDLEELLRPPPPPDTGPQLWDSPPGGPAPVKPPAGVGGKRYGPFNLTKDEYTRQILNALDPSYLQPNPRRRRRR